MCYRCLASQIFFISRRLLVVCLDLTYKMVLLLRRLTEKFTAARLLVRAMSDFKETKTTINGQTINYLKTGDGEHTLFCFPGALGSIHSDFGPQLKGLDHKSFTVIAWDPPGYGHSRPPKRSFDVDFYEKDADMATAFMDQLGVSKYSVLGWSDGGISGMIMAAKRPDAMRKLVIWGSNAYVIGDEVKVYEKMRDISKWSDKMKAPLIDLYGEQGLADMWSGWCDAMNDIYNKKGGDICKAQVAKIQCPTLIVHGDKDPMIAKEHPQFLKENIAKSEIYRFPEGKHNVHLRYAEEFNKLVTDFLKK